MVKIKLTDCGGYIVGDGDLPPGFNCDAFLKKYVGKMIAKGINELEVPEGLDIDTEQVKQQMITEAVGAAEEQIDNAVTYEYDNAKVNQELLIGMLDNVQLQIEQQECNND